MFWSVSVAEMITSKLATSSSTWPSITYASKSNIELSVLNNSPVAGLISKESWIFWGFVFEIAYVICWLSISTSSFELKSKKSYNTSSLVTFSGNTG